MKAAPASFRTYVSEPKRSPGGSGDKRQIEASHRSRFNSDQGWRGKAEKQRKKLHKDRVSALSRVAEVKGRGNTDEEKYKKL